jgi:hypothetical protein
MRTGLIAFIAMLGSLSAAPEKDKGTAVKLDKFTAIAPADWKSEKPANRLRSHQFQLPGFKDNKGAELVIFPDVGTFEKESPRWKGRFQVPDGKTIDDISKTERFKVGKADVALWDVTGTWIYKERPFDPKSKEEIRPNSRVIFHLKEFMDWLKAFK